jgi:hypothetical protein
MPAVNERRHEDLPGHPLHVAAERRVDVHSLVADALQVEHVAHLHAVMGERDLVEPHRDPSL